MGYDRLVAAARADLHPGGRCSGGGRGVGAEGGQLVDGMVERQSLGSRHAIALTTRLFEIADLPHPGIIPRLV
jgi:hypothetical protein